MTDWSHAAFRGTGCEVPPQERAAIIASGAHAGIADPGSHPKSPSFGAAHRFLTGTRQFETP